MNRIYRLVFNRALGRVQVASELASGAGRIAGSATRVRGAVRQPLWLPLLLALWAPAGIAAAADYTLPAGAVIGEGNLSIDASGSASGVLNISQTSNRGLINWQSFNVGTDAQVNFFAPNAGAVTINLIGGNASSTIAGQLSGNGQVFLVNASGIVFSPTASVNVGGLVASGLPFNNDHSDTAFRFGGTSNASEVVNTGTLTATNGSITLLAEGVRNYGTINAAQINLLAAGGATLTRYDASSGITTFTPTLTVDAAVADPTMAAVINLGTLTAGNINLHGRIQPTAAGNVINLGGTVSAQQISSQDGQLSLVARGGDPQSGGGVIQTGMATADRTVVDVAGDYIQSTGSLTTGRLNLAVTGDALFYNPANKIAAIGGVVGKDLTVNNTVALGQSGSLSVTGATTIDTGTGNDIALTQAGNTFNGWMSLTGRNVTVNAASALRLGKVQANSLGVTSGGAIDLHDDINLVGALSLDANGALNQAAGNLLVGGTSALSSNSSITLTQLGNSFGNRVALNGTAVKLASSGTLQLGNVAASSLALTAGRIDINGDISTDGAQTYNGAVYLNAAATLESTNAGNITFGGAVDGARALTVFTNGRVGFLGGVGQTTKVNSVQVQAKGIDLSGNLRTVGLIHLNGPVTLGSAVTLDSELGDINFMSTVNGAHALTVNSRGTSGFYGAVGGTTALTSLTTSADGVTWLGADITTTDGISLADAVLLGADVKATSNNGNITFGGTVNGAHALDLRASNGIVLLQGSVGAATALTGLSVDAQILDTQGIRVAGPLQLVTTNSIVQGGAYEVDGDALFHSSGNVFLNNAANRFKGSVDLVGNAVTIRNTGALALRGVDAFTLDVTATGGGISQSRAIDVRGTSAFSADGDITLGHTANSFGGRVNLDGNALTLVAGSGLDVNVVRHGANAAVSLTSAGQLQLQPGAIDTGNADLTLASGAGVLSTSGALSGRNVQLRGRDGIALNHDVSATGTLGMNTANSAIQQSAGRVQAGGDTTLTAGTGAITLLNAGNQFAGTLAVTGGDVDVTATGALRMASADVGSLALTAASIGQSGALNVSNDSTLIASSGDIRLDNPANTFAGRVHLSGNALTLVARDDLAVTLGAHAANAPLWLEAGRNLQLQPGAIDTGSADLTLISGGGTLATGGALSGHNVRLSGRDGITLGHSVNAAGTLDLASQNGAIVQTGGSVQAIGNTSIAAGTAISLLQAGNAFGGSLALRGGAAAISAAGPLRLAAADVDSLQLVAGSIGQSGALNVAGASDIRASGDITLDAAGNRFGGPVSLHGQGVNIASSNGLQLAQVQASRLQAVAGGALALGMASIDGDADLRGAGVDLGSSRVGGALTVDSSDAITQRGALQVGGSSQLRAAGAVLLDHAGNDFQGAVSAAGNGIRLADANDLQLAALIHTGAARTGLQPAALAEAVSVVAGGTLHLPGSAIDVGNADLALASLGGQLQTQAALRGGNLSLSGRDGLLLGHDVAASGRLALASSSAITQNGGSLQAGVLSGRAGAAATLLGDNQIATLGDFSANGLQLRNARGLAVDGTVQAGKALLLDVRGGDLALNGQLAAGAVRLQSTGALRQAGASRITADTLSGDVGGATRLGDAQTFVANQVGTLGDFRSSGGFSMTNARSLTLASLNGSRFSVDAGSADFALKVDGGDVLQQDTTPVRAGNGHWWSSGRLGTSQAPIYVVTSAANQVVDFVGLPPAYFNAVGLDGQPVSIGGAINVPTSALALRAQSGSLQRVAYVDLGALNAEYRAFGIVQPGIRLPADQIAACDHGDPDAECAQ